MHAENIQRSLFGTTEFTSSEDPQVLHHKNCFPETNLPPQNGPPPVPSQTKSAATKDGKKKYIKKHTNYKKHTKAIKTTKRKA